MQATTVAAQGTAEAPYNLAGFSVSLHATGSSVPLAKAKLKKQVDDLVTAIDSMKKDLSLEFVKNSIRSSSNVQEKYEWIKNENVFKGYDATYSYYFQIDDLSKVSKIYDILTSLQDVRASSPHYSLKNIDKLNKKALKHAFEKVTERFESECKVLGLNPADFEIGTWEATYSDSQRSDRVAAGNARRAVGARSASAAVAVAAAAPMNDAGGGSEPLELVTGLASVTANLEVGYARRATQQIPLKATVVKDSSHASEPTPGKPKFIKENDHV
jgi:uncharacterized protein YggE